MTSQTVWVAFVDEHGDSCSDWGEYTPGTELLLALERDAIVAGTMISLDDDSTETHMWPQERRFAGEEDVRYAVPHMRHVTQLVSF